MGFCFGIFAKEKLDYVLLNSILNEVTLKGKRKITTYQKDNFLYAHLAKSSRQKFYNNNNKQWIFFEGEFFGIKAIKRKYDLSSLPNYNNYVEFVWALYKRYGFEIFRDFDGHFIFTIFDIENQNLKIINDSLGLHPLYIYKIKDHLIFSSEYQPILAIPEFKKILDYSSISEYLTYGIVLDGKTLIKNIKSMKPATIFIYQPGKEEVKYQYETWNYETKNWNIDELADKIYFLMQERFLEMLEDRRVASLPLSGGYDTRFLLGLIPQNMRKEFTWYSNCSPYLDPDQDRDVIIASYITKKFGLKHNIFKLPQEIIFESPLDIFEVLRPIEEKPHIQGHFSYILRWTEIEDYPPYDKIEEKKEKIIKSIFSKKFINQIKKDNGLSYKQLTSLYHLSRKKFFFFVHNSLRAFLNTKFPLNASKWNQPISHFWQPLRTPFLSQELIRILLTVPEEIASEGYLFLYIYDKFNPDLLSIPFVSFPFLKIKDKHICQKIKVIRSGIDYQFVRKKVGEKLFKKYLFSKRTWTRGIYNPRFLLLLIIKYLLEYKLGDLTFVNKLTNHWRYRMLLPERVDHSFVRLEAWLRLYFDS